MSFLDSGQITHMLKVFLYLREMEPDFLEKEHCAFNSGLQLS